MWEILGFWLEFPNVMYFHKVSLNLAFAKTNW